jgi:hypothetical protein
MFTVSGEDSKNKTKYTVLFLKIFDNYAHYGQQPYKHTFTCSSVLRVYNKNILFQILCTTKTVVLLQAMLSPSSNRKEKDYP